MWKNKNNQRAFAGIYLYQKEKIKKDNRKLNKKPLARKFPVLLREKVFKRIVTETSRGS